jgi:hypothetical protein
MVSFMVSYALSVSGSGLAGKNTSNGCRQLILHDSSVGKWVTGFNSNGTIVGLSQGFNLFMESRRTSPHRGFAPATEQFLAGSGYQSWRRGKIPRRDFSTPGDLGRSPATPKTPSQTHQRHAAR